MKSFYLTLLFSVTVATLAAQSNLQVEISNLENSKGSVLFELLDENEKSVKKVTGNIENGLCTIQIKDIKAGKYAARYFHDENSNGELDKNWMGIPAEGYGFSNNAYTTFGPKEFVEWLFVVKGSTKIRLVTVN